MSVSTAIAAMRNFHFYGFDQLFFLLLLISDKFDLWQISNEQSKDDQLFNNS